MKYIAKKSKFGEYTCERSGTYYTSITTS